MWRGRREWLRRRQWRRRRQGCVDGQHRDDGRSNGFDRDAYSLRQGGDVVGEGLHGGDDAGGGVDHKNGGVDPHAAGRDGEGDGGCFHADRGGEARCKAGSVESLDCARHGHCQSYLSLPCAPRCERRW